jgi:hypothetical protein
VGALQPLNTILKVKVNTARILKVIGSLSGQFNIQFERWPERQLKGQGASLFDE